MAVSYHYAKQFVGRSVCAHCIDGSKYYGIVRGVRPDGIWLDVPERGVLAGGDFEKLKTITADRPEENKVETVQFGFRRFFFPFFFLLALTPFFFRRRFFI
ncbi:hypothetical protein [Effusibacillus lacus]|uniref:Uncharacterized protein n=1 Tax=Effusibacillus lacus TaxID=1348429 RepID=A0A292YQS6_9BACL|nr:hypothetical protein [Effusibacillus lacus]TCS76932.1 hypothetical protein EDD64_101156 [Effusibacillus lacus]GAX91261.1 hypothetical protein EFBL_2927 [Effusibacillus lacus]